MNIRGSIPLTRMAFLISLLCWGIPLTGLAYSDRIVAVVNNEVITWMDLQYELQDETKRMRAKFRGNEFQKRYQQKQREVLEKIIEERLQLQEAKAKNISVSPEEVEEALQRTPLPPNQNKEQFARQLLLSRLFEYEVRRNVVVEEEELRRFFEENASQFAKPPMFKLKQVLLEAKTEPERASARLKARNMAKKITSNTTLEELASEFSLFVSDLGWLSETELVDPLRLTIKSLQTDQVSQPVETRLGIHFVAVGETKPSETQAFEDVEKNIRSVLLRERSEKLFRQWLGNLKQKAFIEIKL